MTKEIKSKKYNFRYLLEKYFKIVAPLLFVLVIALGYFIVIGQQLKAYSDSKNIDLAKAVLQNRTLKDSKLYYKKALNNSFLSPDDEKYLSMAVPNDFNFTSIVSQLTSLAQAYNFNAVSINVDTLKLSSESMQSNTIKSIKINLNIAGGDYAQFKSFLNGMENSAMVFDIQSVSFTKSNSYQLEILSYYFN